MEIGVIVAIVLLASSIGMVVAKKRIKKIKKEMENSSDSLETAEEVAPCEE